MTFIIGEDVRIAAARDTVLLGLKGRVVLETMNTITISTSARGKVTLPKSGSALELKGGEIVLGDDLAGRLEDRLAAASRTGRRTR
jgi:RNase P/RNase MRP subunit p29